MTVSFDDIQICGIWVCAQPSLDLESEVQQLQEVMHSLLFPDNSAQNFLSSRRGKKKSLQNLSSSSLHQDIAISRNTP